MHCWISIDSEIWRRCDLMKPVSMTHAVTASSISVSYGPERPSVVRSVDGRTGHVFTSYIGNYNYDGHCLSLASRQTLPNRLSLRLGIWCDNILRHLYKTFLFFFIFAIFIKLIFKLLFYLLPGKLLCSKYICTKKHVVDHVVN